VATLTAMRRAGPGRVALDVDGRPWRTVPDDVVARCGLHAGLALDRSRLRLLRSELRRAEALATAGRALAQRPLSRRRLSDRLRRRGIPPPAEREVLEELAAIGLVDDAKVARARADKLADRGWGDTAIRARLEADGFEETAVRAALAGLSAEADRATTVAAGTSSAHRAWSLLARRGFSPDAIEGALGALDADQEIGLG
jgi:SOS response regulatory protein OraA/RecX